MAGSSQGFFLLLAVLGGVNEDKTNSRLVLEAK